MTGIDILVSATDQASDVLQQVGDSGSTAADNLEISWGKVALAVTGAAAAMEMSNRSMQGVKTSVYQMAERLGITRAAANDLTRSISDVGFSLEDTSAVMTTGIRQGLRTADDIKKYAEYWEMVGRASGESAPELAEAGKTMGTMDVRAKNITDSMGAFDFIIGSTDLSIGFFIQTLGRSSKQLQDAHVGLNDVAMAMGFLESKGYAGKAFMTKFKESLDQAEGSRDTFFKNLGMSAGDLDRYASKMEQAAGSTKKLADAQKDTYTGLQKISAKLKEYQLQYEGLGMAVGNAANVLALLADGGIVFAGAWKIAGSVTTALGISLGWIAVIATEVIAGIAGIVLALKHWNDIGKGVAETMSKFWDTLPEWAKSIARFVLWPLTQWFNLLMKIIDALRDVKSAWPGNWGKEEKSFFAPVTPDQMLDWAKGRNQPKNTGPGNAGVGEMKHSGTITVRGTSDKGQAIEIGKIAVAAVLKDMQRGSRSGGGGILGFA